MENYVVTISRQFASFGRSIAQIISGAECEFYDRESEATARGWVSPYRYQQ